MLINNLIPIHCTTKLIISKCIAHDAYLIIMHCTTMHSDCIAYDKHSCAMHYCAMHWDCIADEKLSFAMH